jgi:hypothetical protein
MHLPSQATVNTPRCHFISPSSAPPTTPLGLVFLAPCRYHQFHLDLDEPRLLAYTAASNQPSAVGDADEDVKYGLRPPRLGIRQ